MTAAAAASPHRSMPIHMRYFGNHFGTVGSVQRDEQREIVAVLVSPIANRRFLEPRERRLPPPGAIQHDGDPHFLAQYTIESLFAVGAGDRFLLSRLQEGGQTAGQQIV